MRDRSRQERPAGVRRPAAGPVGEVVAGGGPVPAGDLERLRILHADMDAFYASIEVRRDPALSGRPLLVGGTGPRGVVTSASYEARAFGCRNAMAMAHARRLCPEAAVLPPDFAAYREVSRTVMRSFRDITPLVEPLALDEAFLDVTGARRLLGDAVAIARRLREDVRAATGLVVTVGVAANKFLAKLGSQAGKPDGLFVIPPSRALDFLHPLPVGALWGVGAATKAVLERYGLRTVGDLARLPEGVLEQALGKSSGARLVELAWGRDDREVVPGEAAKSVGSEETFAADIDDPAVVAREVLRSCVRVGSRLRRAGLAGRTITLKVRFSDFRTVTRSRTLPLPTATDAELWSVAAGLLAGLSLGRTPVRLVGVTVVGLVEDAVPVQLGLEDARPGWSAADRAADAIRARFGEDAVRLAALDEQVPEAYQESRAAPRLRREPLEE